MGVRLEELIDDIRWKDVGIGKSHRVRGLRVLFHIKVLGENGEHKLILT